MVVAPHGHVPCPFVPFNASFLPWAQVQRDVHTHSDAHGIIHVPCCTCVHMTELQRVHARVCVAGVVCVRGSWAGLAQWGQSGLKAPLAWDPGLVCSWVPSHRAESGTQGAVY
jgi:hypothetical protein